jgi:hypothetical protein
MVTKNKQKRRYKLTTFAFKMIPIIHNTPMATPKQKLYYRAFAQLWGPTKIINHNIYGFTLKICSREICPFGESTKLKFYSEAFCHLGGPLVPFGVEGPKIKLYFESIYPFGEAPILTFYSGDFAHFGVHFLDATFM